MEIFERYFDCQITHFKQNITEHTQSDVYNSVKVLTGFSFGIYGLSKQKQFC